MNNDQGTFYNAIICEWDGTENEVLALRRGEDIELFYLDGLKHVVSVSYFNKNGYIIGPQILN